MHEAYRKMVPLMQNLMLHLFYPVRYISDNRQLTHLNDSFDLLRFSRESKVSLELPQSHIQFKITKIHFRNKISEKNSVHSPPVLLLHNTRFLL